MKSKLTLSALEQELATASMNKLQNKKTADRYLDIATRALELKREARKRKDYETLERLDSVRRKALIRLALL
jgi:hypothetical protein